ISIRPRPPQTCQRLTTNQSKVLRKIWLSDSDFVRRSTSDWYLSFSSIASEVKPYFVPEITKPLDTAVGGAFLSQHRGSGPWNVPGSTYAQARQVPLFPHSPWHKWKSATGSAKFAKSKPGRSTCPWGSDVVGG